ncbi:MAG TPA: carbohydrate-binding domain-containing protein, partial [Alphaproteobacteria bacterium]|nr:carbohydrate-binding domain-containing protein [Alphaproteobacteria bacterium]
SSGGFEDVTLSGAFGPEPHTVDVSFVNDAYGGTPDTDRNLYVGGITYDGQDYAGQTAANTGAGPDIDPNAAEVFSNGTVTFDNVGGTVPPGSDTLVVEASSGSAVGMEIAVDGKDLTAGGHAPFGEFQLSSGDNSYSFNGDFGPGSHTVYIHFDSDTGPGIPEGFGAYTFEGLDLNGQHFDPSAAQTDARGDFIFQNIAGGSSSPPPGSDTLVLHLSEDAYNGDAQFAVLVDGHQIGGPTSVTTLHSSGTFQDFTFTGDFGAGPHTVEVDFLNDAWGGTSDTDRNLYVGGITFDGVDYAGNTATDNAANGHAGDDPNAAVMDVNGSVIFSNVSGSSPPPPPPPDTLVLHLSEDAYQGDAQFAVLVDGKEIGGPISVTTLHSSGTFQDFTFNGDFGTGPHTVEVDFLNDAWGGSPDTDRNLYVGGITFDGTNYAGNTATDNAANGHAGDDPTAAVMDVNGSAVFSNVGGSSPPPPPPPPVTSMIVLQVSEDAYQGDAQFLVFVDGVQQGGVQTATASHSAGAVQDVTFTGDFGPIGPDSVAVQFLNDAYGGSPSTDRNLYVQSVDVHLPSTPDTHLFAGNTAIDDAANGHGADDPSAAVMDVNGTATFNVITYGDTSGDLSDSDHAAAQSLGGNWITIGDAHALSGSAVGGNDTVTMNAGSSSVIAIGDAQTITDEATGGNDTVTANGNVLNGTAYGDALTLSGDAHGGDDSVSASGRGTAIAYGDAQTISGDATGGNDTVTLGGNRFGSFAYGDAQTITDHGHGGDDVITALGTQASPDIAQLFGDAHTLSGFAVGGNDTITGTQTGTQMYGDGFELLDNSQGGNDTLISGPADDQMWGDAATVAPTAQTGDDLFVFNRASANNLGNDTIEDFQPGKDHIELQNYSGVSSFSDLSSHITDTSSGETITFDSQNTILVANDHNLTASDFLFA